MLCGFRNWFCEVLVSLLQRLDALELADLYVLRTSVAHRIWGSSFRDVFVRCEQLIQKIIPAP